MSIQRTSHMVARDDELRELQLAFDRAVAGDGSAMLISGEPGIGKTRLIQSFVDSLRTRDALVLQTAFYEDMSIPFRSLLDAFKSSTQEYPLDVNLLAGRATMTSIEERVNFFDRVLLQLRQASSERPVVLVLEDMHWAPEPDLELFRFLARGSRSWPLLLIASYRDVEVASSGPLESTVLTLNREGIARRLPVRRLDRTAARAMIASLLGAGLLDIDDDVLTVVQDEAEGVPFFIEELLLHLVESGLIRRSGDRWTVQGDVRGLIPQSVRSVVGHRLRSLSSETQETLSAAAVIGPTFHGSLLQRVCEAVYELTGLALDERLQDAIDRYILTMRNDGRDALYRFAHDQIRDVLYENLGQVRRRLLHQAVAEAIELTADHDDPDHVLLLAHHFGAGGDLVRAARYARLAAERALILHAPHDAVGQLNEALDIHTAARSGRVDGYEPDDVTEFELLMLRESAFDMLRDRDAQQNDLVRLEELSVNLDDVCRIALADRASRFAVQIGDRSLARHHAGRWRELVASQHVELQIPALVRQGEVATGRLMGEPSRLHRADGDLSEAWSLYHEALKLADRGGDRHWSARISQELGVLEWHLADPADTTARARARERLATALEGFRAIGDARGEVTALIALAYRRHISYNDAGPSSSEEQSFVSFLEDIRRLRTRERKLVRASDSQRTEALALLSVHVHAREFGIYEIALERGREALRWAEAARDPRLQFYALGGLSETEHHLGRPSLSLEYAERASALLTPASANRLAPDKANAWLGLALEGIGDVERAEWHLRQAVQVARQRETVTAVAQHQVTLAGYLYRRYGVDAADEIDLLCAEVVEMVDRLPGSAPWSVEALVVQTQLALARGMTVSALASSTAAMSRLRERNVVLFRVQLEVAFVYGQALIANGEYEAGFESIAEAAGMLSRSAVRIHDPQLRESYLTSMPLHRWIKDESAALGIWVSITDDQLPASPTAGGLTRREHEIIRLVALGRTNREIADELFISDKTVARHLTNIFTKLDIESRTQAAAWAYQNQLI